MALKEFEGTNNPVILHLGEKDVLISKLRKEGDEPRLFMKHSYPGRLKFLKSEGYERGTDGTVPSQFLNPFDHVCHAR